MSEFQALLDELDTLRKASKQDDEDIRSAADGDADDDGMPDDKDIEEDYEDEDEDEESKPVIKKAFRVTTADGEEIDAIDGTELIKSLSDEIASERQQTVKAITGAVDLIKSLKTEIGALRDQVQKIAKAPAGRKSVLNVHEKQDVMEKAMPEQRQASQQILAKALKAQRDGRLHGGQVAEIESYLNRGFDLPPHLSAPLAD